MGAWLLQTSFPGRRDSKRDWGAKARQIPVDPLRTISLSCAPRYITTTTNTL